MTGEVMERWVPLLDYPGYYISDEGRVRNRKDRFMRIHLNNRGRPFIGLMVNGEQVKRGLALLVAQTFILPPRADFTTPIHLDGNPINCEAQNLQWRPRWFALEHSRQFHLDLGNHGPVRHTKTGIVYHSIWEVVLKYGLLYNDVLLSIINKTYVFPWMGFFEWVDPN
jgi:hypothetical protein